MDLLVMSWVLLARGWTEIPRRGTGSKLYSATSETVTVPDKKVAYQISLYWDFVYASRRGAVTPKDRRK